MFSISSWLHLRIPFSFLLLPVFLFALAYAPNFTEKSLGLVFFILHFLVYPASNGYNSYYDKDKMSIGLLKNPPEVGPGLLYLSLVLDIIALVLAFQLSFLFAVLVLIYGLASKAYSHPRIRLKKYPWIGWFIAGFFQGFFTFLMAYEGLNGFGIDLLLRSEVLIPAILSSGMLWGAYPMTQIYQHEEDGERGDRTLSLMLGIKGTFRFSALVFGLAGIGFMAFFYITESPRHALYFLLAILPVLVFFFIWWYRASKSVKNADYKSTMWLNLITAICLNSFFFWLFMDKSQIVQVLKMGW